MGSLTITAVRTVMVLMLAGSAFVQVVLCADLATGGDVVEVPWQLAAYLVIGIALVQVSTLSVWRLVTMVRRGTVFSHAAFRYVDIVSVMVAAACVLTFGLAAALAPGDAPPGIVFMVCGVALVAAGVALLVRVMRALLAQAVQLDEHAASLEAELEEVI